MKLPEKYITTLTYCMEARDTTKPNLPTEVQTTKFNPSTHPVLFKQLVPKLTFIKIKITGVRQQGKPLLSIPEADSQTIISSF
jgi:hypothetical protein